MITPARLAVLCFFVAFVHVSRPADACSCASLSPKGYMGAKRVFVAMALPVNKAGGKRIQKLRILHTLKGPVTKFFTLNRRGGVRMCEAQFRPGIARIVFTNGTHVSTCSGNYSFAYMRRIYARVFKLGTPKTGVPDTAGFKLALRRTLGPYVGPYVAKRKPIAVLYPALAGTTFTVAGTRVRFVRAAAGKRVVRITGAVTSGPIQFIQGTLASEGVTFAVLINRPTFKVINRYVVER